ncbi:MAG: PhzF family phenazine biosynthesis protein [Panacagrimonas sp.]
MKLRFHTLDVFTDIAFGGNPLAVVLDADDLNTAQMQRIAREFNLSETVFVQRPTLPQALVRLRIFTPTTELPFAGHPTVGAASLLAELGLAPEGADVRFVLEEAIGPVPVRVRRVAEQSIHAELTAAVAPSRRPALTSIDVIAQMLGLAPGDIGSAGEEPRTGDCGLPFLLIPLRVPELLAALDPDFSVWKSHGNPGDPDKFYVYARGYEGEIRARMFAPGVGVAEDPATGSAAAALAGVLAIEHSAPDAQLDWTLHQGAEMGRPSLIRMSADKREGVVTAVRVGGHAVQITRGEIRAS